MKGLERLTIVLVMAAALAALAAPVRAGNDERVGTSGAGELRLPVGAQSIALAGSNVGSVSGVEALFYNPAGIAGTDSHTEVQFSHTEYLADIQLNFVGLVQSLGNLGSLGVSAKVVSFGDIPFTTETAPDGNGETFSPTFSTLGLTFARRMTDRVNFGGTVYYVAERIMQETAAGAAFDFGFQYDTGFRGVHLGMSMKNFGRQMTFNGSDLERDVHLTTDDPQAKSRTLTLTSADFELPSYFQLGTSVPLMRGMNEVTAHGLYQSNSFGLDNGCVGLEYGYRHVAALRAGYMYNTDQDQLFGFTYGAGLGVSLGGSKLTVDYAGQTVRDFFDDIQHVTVSMRF